MKVAVVTMPRGGAAQIGERRRSQADAGVNALMQRARDALKKKDAQAALGGFEAAAARALRGNVAERARLPPRPSRRPPALAGEGPPSQPGASRRPQALYDCPTARVSDATGRP